MSNIQLLDKTRKIVRLLSDNADNKFSFDDICKVLSELLQSNVSVISKKGKVLGSNFHGDIKLISDLVPMRVGAIIDKSINERFLNVLSTMENISLMTFGLSDGADSEFEAIIVPVITSAKRLGTIFIYRNNDKYDIEDIIIGEYGASIIGLEMLKATQQEYQESSRKHNVVKAAFATLSFSEKEAMYYLLKELDKDEGILVASRVAEKTGITRSVIVNAIRKLESAGVIESHSAGMRGTYIKIVNDEVFSEMSNYKK